MLHCSAGRDRTGLVVTMLLALAAPGAAGESAAVHDEASVSGINESHRVSPVRHPCQRSQDDAELAPLLAGRREALAGFAAGLDAEGYLLAHGLTRSELAAVRAKLAG